MNFNVKRTSLYTLIAMVLMFSSCRSYKDLTIMRDLAGQEALKGKPTEQPVYKIKTLDNLFVSIISSNADMNAIFNPAFSSANPKSSTNLMYQEVPIQYLYGYQVAREGHVTIPLIGNINVAGMTLLECENEIHKKAEEYLKDFTVKVRLLNYKVTVMGEVTKPGVYYNYNYNFTVMDAISMANGINDFADLEKVVVVRPTATGSQTFTLNLSSKDALASQAYYIQPNDIVIVQPARYKNLKLRTPAATLALSTLATTLLILSILRN